MRYAVLTTRHHNGFPPWPSAVSDWSIGQFLPGRDLVREFIDAFRAAGLAVGFYYSLSDWHHPDYPAFTEADKPYCSSPTAGPSTLRRGTATSSTSSPRCKQLLTDYGDVALLWFDGQWERARRGSGRPEELRAMIRSSSPTASSTTASRSRATSRRPSSSSPPSRPTAAGRPASP